MPLYCLSVAFLATVISAWNPGEYLTLQVPFLPVPKVPNGRFENVKKNLMGGLMKSVTKAIKKRNHPFFTM